MKIYKNELLDALCFYFVFLLLSQKTKEKGRIEEGKRKKKN